MRRRVEVPLEVPYGQDVAGARERVLAAAAGVEGVSADPAPRVLTQELGSDARSLRLTVWVDSRSHDPGRVRSELLDAVARILGGSSSEEVRS
jgi:small-conductance mechanosensitive channel